ncbi:MAG: hypothetical protein M1816_000825 [Peltula sp. TS41687]|nr:MAG: hypothetical protein M1816_000825 [Peltula sp. TS41687]
MAWKDTGLAPFNPTVLYDQFGGVPEAPVARPTTPPPGPVLVIASSVGRIYVELMLCLLQKDLVDRCYRTLDVDRFLDGECTTHEEQDLAEWGSELGLTSSIHVTRPSAASQISEETDRKGFMACMRFFDQKKRNT